MKVTGGRYEEQPTGERIRCGQAKIYRRTSDALRRSEGTGATRAALPEVMPRVCPNSS
jgi:hypothetical protein